MLCQQNYVEDNNDGADDDITEAGVIIVSRKILSNKKRKMTPIAQK